MAKEKVDDRIDEFITKIQAPEFSLSQLTPDCFAPAPDDNWEGGGAAFWVAAKRNKNRKKWEERIKITQLRKLFAEIKQLERELKAKGTWENRDSPLPDEIQDKLLLLQPELAYARGRGLIDQKFFKLMRVLLKKLKTVGDFRRFSEFLTAVLAYSKYLKEG